MKKVFSLINCLLLIFILLSCSNTITIVIKSDKLEDINYTLEKKDNYTVSDLMVFDTEYLFSLLSDSLNSTPNSLTSFPSSLI